MPIPKPRHIAPDNMIGQTKHKLNRFGRLFNFDQAEKDQERECWVILPAYALAEAEDGTWVRLIGDDTDTQFKLPKEQVRYADEKG